MAEELGVGLSVQTESLGEWGLGKWAEATRPNIAGPSLR